MAQPVDRKEVLRIDTGIESACVPQGGRVEDLELLLQSDAAGDHLEIDHLPLTFGFSGFDAA
jgi:hypothetical protein